MPTPIPTLDELVQVLRHTDLPTLLVEGDDDMTVFRFLESQFPKGEVDVLQCNGRDRLLELFCRNAEYPACRAAFLADKDMWMFTSIPAEYSAVIFTRGCSIENDVLADAKPEAFLTSEEQPVFSSVCSSICRWFAFEVEEYRAHRPCKVGVSASKVIPDGKTDPDPAFLAARGFREPNKGLATRISRSYRLRLRGKTLLQLYKRAPRCLVWVGRVEFQLAGKGPAVPHGRNVRV